MLLPSTPIVHSRQWKGQVPYLSRTHRVVTFDGRGNGLSDRPTDPDAYRETRDRRRPRGRDGRHRHRRRGPVGLCGDGVWRSIQLAATRPERVLGIVAFAAGVPLLVAAAPVEGRRASFDDELPTDEGWAKQNRHYWRRDYPGFARFFFEEITSEPHSTKQIEDAVEWALDGSVDAMLADMDVERTSDLAIGRGDLSRRHLPDADRPRHRGHLPAHRAVAPAVRADRRAARRRRGRRPHDPGPPPGARQPADPRLRPIPREDRGVP